MLRWNAGNSGPLDAAEGPCLTIETKEVARQVGSETPDERKTIAQYIYTHPANPNVCPDLSWDDPSYAACVDKNDPGDMN